MHICPVALNFILIFVPTFVIQSIEVLVFLRKTIQFNILLFYSFYLDVKEF